METLQSTLTYAIEIVVMSFVSFVIVDVVNTAFASCTKAYIAAHVQLIDASLVPELATTPSVTPEPTTPVIASEPDPTPDPWQEQPAQLPNPWELATDIQPTPTQSKPAVVLPFPSLRLLPPAASVVQPTKTKSAKTTAKQKSTSTTKTSKRKTAVTPTRSKSRRKAA